MSDRKIWIVVASFTLRKRWWLAADVVTVVKGRGYEDEADAHRAVDPIIAQLKQDYGRTLRDLTVRVHDIDVASRDDEDRRLSPTGRTPSKPATQNINGDGEEW